MALRAGSLSRIPLKPPVYPIALKGESILTRPRFNKGTGFTIAERKTFGLTGRLPSHVNTLQEQCDRAYAQLQTRETAIRKNSFLQSLKDQNWTLYYALLRQHLKECVPIIYTPTQADAIAEYSHLFRRSEGLFLTFTDQETMEEDFLEQTRGRDIGLFVCTDSEAILGIGDQGVGGIGISTAKSVMYTLIGGLDPSNSLAVVLDVGTNNEELLNDPLYVGWRHRRVTGKEYDDFVDRFVQLVRKHFPHSLLHFEDFGIKNAHRILDRYKETHAVFNDDIQGTGAVTLACIMAAIGVSARSRQSSSPSLAGSNSPLKHKTLSDQRYVILGAGSAGMGIAVQVRDAMVTADNISKSEATKGFWMVDREGLVCKAEGASEESGGTREEFARDANEEGWDTKAGIPLLEVVKKVKPTVLIGCSTAAGAFTEEVVNAMMAGLDVEGGERPIILPLSNPSRLVEAKPADLLKWTGGKALVATGSPFENVKMVVDGKEREFVIAECNNALIYPGLGFGAILSESRTMTDSMLIAGAKKLAALSPAIKSAESSQSSNDSLSNGSTTTTTAFDDEYTGQALLPDFAEAPHVNFEIGVAVAEQAILDDTAGYVDSNSGEATARGDVREWAMRDVREKAGQKIWLPVYGEYVYDPDGLN